MPVSDTSGPGVSGGVGRLGLRLALLVFIYGLAASFALSEFIRYPV